MLRERLVFACFASFIMLVSPPVTCEVKKNQDYCPPSSCGNIKNISYPFRLKGDPLNCGLQNNELSCDNNNRTILQIDSGRFYVQEINYDNKTIRVIDPGLQKDNCSSLPLYSLTQYSFTVSDDYRFYDGFQHDYIYWTVPITFIDCATPVNSSLYIDTTVCNGESSSSLNESSSLLLLQRRHTYVVVGGMSISDLEDSCKIGVSTRVSCERNISQYDLWYHPEKSCKLVGGMSLYDDVQKNFNVSFYSIHDALLFGFNLSWVEHSVSDNKTYYFLNSYCYFDNFVPYCTINCFTRNGSFDVIARFGCILHLMSYSGLYKFVGLLISLLVPVRFLCGSLCLFAFLVYKWRRRHLSLYDNIEEFIQSHNKLTPIRYSYSEIKKMTKGFKDKLGKGGYGSVFKGKLRSGHLVAVKILGNSKANGQDFINEVASIGRIHHANVAQLIGFCAERSKRALVYDFMPNGSLEKYIFSREEVIFLSFEKLYAISLGIARGIEYLHIGCDMQILHFDIKPHNILLDEKFTPKVSDFGLAKLYPTDDSIVNLTAARGTMGYMAPELFYKNIGGVSYKADVYSFGMLLMEMASKRKNLNPSVEKLSQIYFPSWIYDQFSDGKDIEMGDATEEERKIAKKMIVVAFWCIQLKPTDRPSMSKVVEMLEGNVELEMPPKPFVSPQDVPVEDHEININPTELSIPSGPSTDSISLIVNEI